MPIIKNCDICGSKPESLFRLQGVHSDSFVSICPNDGLVFLSPSPTLEQLHEYYSNNYDDDYRKEIKSDGVVPYENFEVSFSRINKHLALPEGHVLDIGSGMGWAIDVFRKYLPSSSYFAIEASNFCQIELSKKSITLVTNDFYSHWEKEYEEYFSIIHLRHVFEHFLEPNLALQKIRKSLTKDGLLYLCVPDMLNPMSPIKTFWFRLVHSHYYTENTLGALLRKNGYKIIDSNRDEKLFELWIIARVDSSSTESESRAINEASKIKGIISRMLKRERSIKINYGIKKIIKNIIGYRNK